MTHQVQFMLYTNESLCYSDIRLYCNDVLIDEFYWHHHDCLILTKPITHEEDGTYKYTFRIVPRSRDEVAKQEDVNPKTVYTKDGEGSAMLLYAVLVNGHPYQYHVDSLHHTDAGWLKNTLWKNDKNFIFGEQPCQLLLTLRSGYVMLDNQTPLKNVKGMNKLLLEGFEDKDSTQENYILNNANDKHQIDHVSMIAEIDQDANLIIRKNTQSTDKNLQMEQYVTGYIRLLQFIDRSVFNFQMMESLPEYYKQFDLINGNVDVK